MDEAFVTALLWAVFGGTHVGLTLSPVRTRLVRWLGEGGFVIAYSIVAIITFAALVHYVALHRYDAASATLWVSLPPVRGALLVLSVLGFSLFVTAVTFYPSAPMAVFRHRTVPVRGVAQITRHPFFSGLALWAGAHALLAPSRVAFVFFVGVIVFCWVGGLHQDRRLIQELGEPYRAYVASTSFWPFGAVAAKRQQIRWEEQPWMGYALGVGASLALYQVHDHILDHGGAYVITAVALGSIIAIFGSKTRARKAGVDV